MHIDFVIQSSPDTQKLFPPVPAHTRIRPTDRPTRNSTQQRSNADRSRDSQPTDQSTNQPINQCLQSRSHLLGLSNKLPFLRTTIQHYSLSSTPPHHRRCSPILIIILLRHGILPSQQRVRQRPREARCGRVAAAAVRPAVGPGEAHARVAGLQRDRFPTGPRGRRGGGGLGTPIGRRRRRAR